MLKQNQRLSPVLFDPDPATDEKDVMEHIVTQTLANRNNVLNATVKRMVNDSEDLDKTDPMSW